MNGSCVLLASRTRLLFVASVLAGVGVGFAPLRAEEPVPIPVSPPGLLMGLPASVPGAPSPVSTPVPPHAAPKNPARPFTLADLKAQVALSPEGHFLLTIPQVCHTAADPEVRAILSGKSIQTLAQLTTTPAEGSKRPQVRASRQQISCCSSHARTYGLGLTFGEVTPPIPLPAWAKVTGRLTFERDGLELVPVLQVTHLEAAAAPAQPLLD